MKKIIAPALGLVISVFSLTTGYTATGKKDLPKVISAPFAARYPAARIKKWEMKDKDYVVLFEENKYKYMGWYSPDGQWIRTERVIAMSKDLPGPVRQGWNGSPYASWHIDKIREVMTADVKPVYVLHIDDGNQYDSDHYAAFKKDYIVTFTAEGDLKSKEPYVPAKVLNPFKQPA